MTSAFAEVRVDDLVDEHPLRQAVTNKHNNVN